MNKQVVKKVKAENVEKMLKKCPIFEKSIRKNLETMVREANPASKALEENIQKFSIRLSGGSFFRKSTISQDRTVIPSVQDTWRAQSTDRENLLTEREKEP